jgi:O-antigen/teichoic acid export membrane protein
MLRLFTINNKSTAYKIGSNSLWAALEVIVEILLTIGVSALMAHIFSKKSFGMYSFLFTLISFLSLTSLPGLYVVVFRATAKQLHGVFIRATKFGFLTAQLGSIILLTIAGLYMFRSNQAMARASAIAALLFPFYYGIRTWMSYMQGRELFKIYSIFRIFSHLGVSIALSLALIITRGNFIVVVTTYLVTVSILQVTFYYKSKAIAPPANDEIEPNWLASSIKLTAINLSSHIYNYADKLIVGIFLGVELLAVYTIASGIVFAINSLIEQSLTASYPHIFRANPAEILNIIKRTIPTIFILVVAATFVLIMITPIILPLLYSTKYLSAVLYTQLYLAILPLAGILFLLTAITTSLKGEAFLAKTKIYIAIFIVILYLALIPLFGIYGALISSVIYYVLEIVVQSIYLRNKLLTFDRLEG